MNTNKNIYPLSLTYCPKETVWGGSKLSNIFGKSPAEGLGETWELSVRNDENSIIKNGPCAGLPLKEYISAYTSYFPSQFPILIKFIDAKDDLSIQVHPDDEYARSIGEENGKTEMWYVIEAEENASIVYGNAHGLNIEDLKDAVLSGKAEDVLTRVNVSAGDVFFIPAGLIHAIGKGVLIAEIQQNSDTTFRLYDYGRRDKHGNTRPLHIDHATKAFKNFTDAEIKRQRFSSSDISFGGTPLASCEYFTVEKHTISDKKHFHSSSSPFISLLCIKGEGRVNWEYGSEKICAGDSFYIPKELSSFSISGNLELLTTVV